MIGFYHQLAGKLTVCSGHGNHTDSIHAGDLSQILLHLKHELQCPLGCVFWLQGVSRGKTGKFGEILVPFRIVLHGAASQGIESRVHSVVHLTQSCEVPNQLTLAYLRQLEFLTEQVPGW